MDGFGAQRDPRGSQRQSPHPRSPSRASSSTSSRTTHTHPHRSSKSIEIGSSTRLSHTLQNGSHLGHKYHHSTSTATSKLSKEYLPEAQTTTTTTTTTATPATPVSSYLQERLQRERQTESDRVARRMSGADLSPSTGDARLRDAGISPTRQSITPMGTRPRSDSDDESASYKGLGLRETAQVISTIKNENWKLKLQIFHLQERQKVLEAMNTQLEEENKKVDKSKKVLKERSTQLEGELAKMTEIQEDLLSELKRRDKAVGEAVAMIVRLEAQVEELLREREMVRQVEADIDFRHLQGNRSEDSGATLSAPMDSNQELTASTSTGHRALGRMPSFMSELSENTENLRDYVMKNKNSFMHLRKVSESIAEEGSDINRIVSPSFSVLSESSFMSIYGYGGKDKEDQGPTSPPQLSDPLTWDEDPMGDTPTPGKQPSKANRESYETSKTPSRMPGGAAKGGASLSTHMQSLNDILDKKSPLQELAMLDKNFTRSEISQHLHSTQGRSRNTPSPISAGPSRPASRVKTKQEKREALQRVLTASPEHKEVRNTQALPPTPDTISTSTLRRYQNSNDTLAREPRFMMTHMMTQDTYVSDGISNGSNSMSDAQRSQRSHHVPPSLNSPAHPASITAFTSRKNMPLMSPIDMSFSNYAAAQSLPRRPRSAGETTSRTRESWASDSEDSDGGADAYSDDTNFDYWMRESNKPEGPRFNLSMPPPITTHACQPRSTSPDLFSFPEESQTWKTDDLLGAMHNAGFMEAPISPLKRDPLEEFGLAPHVSMETPQSAMYQPPVPEAPDGTGGVRPPDRGSSLHARTGSLSRTGSLTGSAIAPVNGKLRKSPVKSVNSSIAGKTRKMRSNSVDSVAAMPPPKMMQLQQQQQQFEGQGGGGGAVVTPVAKSTRSPYPPISGQTASGRTSRLGGLNGLFKRHGRSESLSRTETASVSTPTAPSYLAQQQQQKQVQYDSPRPFVHPGRSSVPPPPTLPWPHNMIRAPGVFEQEASSATPPPIMRSRMPPPSRLSFAAGPEMDIQKPLTPRRESVQMMEGGATSVPDTPQGNVTPSASGRKRWLGLGRMHVGSKKGNNN